MAFIEMDAGGASRIYTTIKIGVGSIGTGLTAFIGGVNDEQQKQMGLSF